MPVVTAEQFWVNSILPDVPTNAKETFVFNSVITDLPTNSFENIWLNQTGTYYTGIPDGPNWFGVVDAETRWIPGTIYNNQRFVRYRMWDGTKWQTS